MAVPSSGAISLKGVHQELNTNNYSTSLFDGNSISLKECSDGTEATINTANASADRPDGSTPHAMSEFYAYDHDATSGIPGFMVDDFTGTPTSTRATFGATSLGDSQSTSDGNSNVTAQRPQWSTLGGGTSHVSNDYIKMSNTTNANHSQWRTTNIDMRTPTSAATINVSSVQFVWEFNFYIDGNKDLRFFLEAGNSLSTSGWNTGGSNWKGYAFTFDDDSTRNIRWQKWTTSGTPTTITTTANNSFTLNTYNTCKITRFTTGRWKLEINGSTYINGVTDSTNYTTFYAYRFWTAKNGSGVDNRVDWLHTYTE